MAELFESVLEKWREQIRRDLAKYWWGPAVGLLITFAVGVGEHKFYSLVVEALGAEWINRILGWFPTPLSRAIVVAILLVVAPLVGILIHAYITASKGKDEVSKEPPFVIPKLVIHYAVYGTSPHNDVVITDTLNDCSRDALVIPVDNNLVSHDPAPNQPKRLFLKYSYGNASIFEVSRPEGSRLILPEDSELQRLKDELDRLDTEANDWREPFRNPRWEIINGHTFTNTHIDIDGKAFRNCTFTNVTFTFHGKAPTEFTADNHFSGQTFRIDTDDPAVMMFLQLQKIAQSIPGATAAVRTLDAKGNILPDNFSISLGQKLPAEKSTPKEQAECLSDDIRNFLKEIGPRPPRKTHAKQLSESELAQDMAEHSVVLIPWLHRLQGGWFGRFDDRAKKTRHLLAEHSTVDFDLDRAIDAPKDEGNLLRIADKFLLLSRQVSS